MKSRIFTPHDPESETAIKALALRNQATPLGMGALVSALLAAATTNISVACHNNGVVETFASVAASEFDDGSFTAGAEKRMILGEGDSRSKILSVIGSEYTVEIVHDDETLALNAVANLVAKPQPPTYTILSLVNDIADKLDEILLDETDSYSFTKWTIVVNQADQSVLCVLHNGLTPIDGVVPVATFFDVAGVAIASFAEEQPLVCLDRLVGTVPNNGAGGGVDARPAWE